VFAEKAQERKVRVEIACLRLVVGQRFQTFFYSPPCRTHEPINSHKQHRSEHGSEHGSH